MDSLTQRLFDLVRYQRHELFEANLISDEEFTELAKEHAAVARLESYDEVRAKITALEAEMKRLRDGLTSLRMEHIDQDVLGVNTAIDELLSRQRRLDGTTVSND